MKLRDIFNSCFWGIHCFHEINGSRTRIEFKTDCKINPTTPFESSGYVCVRRDMKCCKCEKVIDDLFHDADWSRAKKYPVKEVL